MHSHFRQLSVRMHFRTDWIVPKTCLKTFFKSFKMNTKILKHFMKYFTRKKIQVFNISVHMNLERFAQGRTSPVHPPSPISAPHPLNSRPRYLPTTTEQSLTSGTRFTKYLTIYRTILHNFSALTLLVGWQEGHPACKNWVVGCWRGCLSGARCRLAYGPADATATHCLLLQ